MSDNNDNWVGDPKSKAAIEAVERNLAEMRAQYAKESKRPRSNKHRAELENTRRLIDRMPDVIQMAREAYWRDEGEESVKSILLLRFED